MARTVQDCADADAKARAFDRLYPLLRALPEPEMREIVAGLLDRAGLVFNVVALAFFGLSLFQVIESFPEPELTPILITGIAADWKGVGSSIPSDASASISSGPIPRSSKDSIRWARRDPALRALDPNLGFTAELDVMRNLFVNLGATFDRSAMISARLWADGDTYALAATADRQLVQFTDPFTHISYWAVHQGGAAGDQQGG